MAAPKLTQKQKEQLKENPEKFVLELLQAQIKEKETLLSSHKTELEELKKSLDNSSEVEALNQQINDLKSNHSAEVTDLEKRIEKEAKDKNAALKKVSEIQEETKKITLEVPGTYTSKKHKDEDGNPIKVRFVKGSIKTRIPGVNEPVDSAELIKAETEQYQNAMERFIEIGYGLLERV